MKVKIKNSKIWIAQEQKIFLKWNKNISLALKVLCFRFKNQVSIGKEMKTKFQIESLGVFLTIVGPIVGPMRNL